MTSRRRALIRDQGGFTLLEVMVVVLVIGILLAVGVPTYLGARGRAQDKAAESTLRNGLTAASAIFTDNASFADATPAELAAAEPGFAWVDATVASTDDQTLSVAAAPDGSGWGAATMSDSGTCFFLRVDDSGAAVSGGSDTAACTGTQALTVTASGLTGGGGVTLTAGVLDLDGSEGVRLASELALSDDFTIEAWVRMRSGTAVSNADGLVRSESERQNINFAGGFVRLWDDPAGWDHVIAGSPTSAGTWTHVAFTRESGVLRVYLDGSLSRTGVGGYTNTFRVGTIGSALVGHLDGELDELRIWSVARTEAELASGRLVVADPAAAGLVAYYPFDVDPDGRVLDLVGGNHGTLPAGGSITDGGSALG